MTQRRLLLFIIGLLLACSVRAGDPPFLPRFQPLEKAPGVKLLRVLGAGELPSIFTRASAIADDGRTAAYVDYVSIGDDKVRNTRVLLWDIPAGRFRKEIHMQGHVSALTLSPDGSNLLAGTITEENKKEVYMVSHWDAVAGKRLRVLGMHNDPIFTLAFSPLKTQTMSGSWSQLKCWDLAKGSLHKEITFGGNKESFAAAYLPDGKKIICGLNQDLRVLDLTETDPKKAAAGVLDLTGHQDMIVNLAVSSDGKIAVSASRDDTIRSWDLVKGKPLHTLKKNVPAGRYWISLGLGDDGKTVFSSWSDSESDSGAAILSLWDAASGKEAWSRSSNYRGAVPIRVRGQHALSGGGCNVLNQWDLAKGTIEYTWGGPKGAVNAVRADAQGRCYCAGQDGYVHIGEKDQILRSIPAHTEPIVAIALNAKATQLFTASADKTVKLWEPATGKLLQTLSGHEATVTAVVPTRDGKRAYTASSDRTIKLWDLETGKSLATLAGHSEGVNTIALAADETWLASGSDDTSIRLWPLKDGQHDLSRDAIVLEEHKKAVTCLAFSPDGKTLLSASQDQTLKVWDWANGKLQRSIPAHKNWITSLLVVDAKAVLTISDDLTLCRWNYENGEKNGQVDFGVIGDCPRCVAQVGADRYLVGTSSWLLFEIEMAPRKTKE